jgi:hypothetical protein
MNHHARRDNEEDRERCGARRHGVEYTGASLPRQIHAAAISDEKGVESWSLDLVH